MNLLGVMHYELKNYPKAIDCFEKATKLYSKYELAGQNKILCLNKINSLRKLYTSSGKVVYK